MNDKLEYFIWLVPVGVLFTGLFQVFSAWNTRQRYIIKMFQESKVVQSSTTAISQFSLKYN